MQGCVRDQGQSGERNTQNCCQEDAGSKSFIFIPGYRKRFINYHAVEECIADTTKLKNREISHHCRCDFFSFGLRAVFVDLNEFFCPGLDTSKIKIHSRDLNDEEQCC